MNDTAKATIEGVVHDTIEFTKDVEIDGKKFSKGDVLEIDKSNNLVVNNARNIISSLLAGKGNLYGNIWWEVGEGEESWEDDNLPEPSLKDTELTKATYRKKIKDEDINFLDPETNEVSKVPTNKIEMVTVFLPDEANGHLREFSIRYGGDGKLNSGEMFNRKHHGVIYKTNGIKLTRKIHFLITF